jgi:hypothetical protein
MRGYGHFLLEDGNESLHLRYRAARLSNKESGQD